MSGVLEWVKRIGQWIVDLVKRPVNWFLGGLSVIIGFAAWLFDYITGFVVDFAVAQFPELPELFSGDLFGYFIKTFHVRDFFQLLVGYLGVCVACYASHFIGIPITYVVKFLRIR